jgi:hypothetical protein
MDPVWPGSGGRRRPTPFEAMLLVSKIDLAAIEAAVALS